MNLNLPRDKELAVHVINGAQAKEQMVTKMGLLGRIFGSGDEKSGNIAGFVLIASFIAVLLLLWLSAAYPQARGVTEAIAGFFTVITTTVGYIFGRKASE